jgi:hypothetical protein
MTLQEFASVSICLKSAADQLVSLVLCVLGVLCGEDALRVVEKVAPLE